MIDRARARRRPATSRCSFIGSPITMDASACRSGHAPPRLGEHNAEVLRELGYDAERIADAARGQGAPMSVRIRRATNHVAASRSTGPRCMNAVDRATEAELQRIWDEHRARSPTCAWSC